jgi:hypothetical protein
MRNSNELKSIEPKVYFYPAFLRKIVLPTSSAGKKEAKTFIVPNAFTTISFACVALLYVLSLFNKVPHNKL